VRQRDHRCDQHEKVDGDANADERRREPAGRLGDDDQVGSTVDGMDHGIRVLGESRRIVVARKIRGDDVVASSAQLGLDEVPVPPDVAGAVDQDVRRHAHTLARVSRVGNAAIG
jgi:hypothetical protein